MRDKQQIEIPAFIGFRPTPADTIILRELRGRLGVDWAALFRLAIRALAIKEGVI